MMTIFVLKKKKPQNVKIWVSPEKSVKMKGVLQCKQKFHDIFFFCLPKSSHFETVLSSVFLHILSSAESS